MDDLPGSEARFVEVRPSQVEAELTERGVSEELNALTGQAADRGNLHLLRAATITLAAMVITINRLVWRRLYALASTRFKLES